MSTTGDAGAPGDDGVARRTGRPRLNRRPVGDPSDEILAVASRLFRERGVMATTMSLIAREAGLQQSSLYYYFRRKEEVLAAIVARANVVPLELAARVQREGGSAAARLHRFIRGDVVALCRLPFDINEVHRYAARDIEGFDRYWRERATLERRVATMVRDGVRTVELRDVNPRLTALTIMSNDEAVQNWYRVGTGARRDPLAIGTFVADLTVGGLLASEAQVDAVREEATRLDGAP